MIYPALRCEDCDVNWPSMHDRFKTCPLCEQTCKSVSRADRQPITEGAVRRLLKEKAEQAERLSEAVEDKFESVHGHAVYSHRFDFFMRMGFGPAESQELANTYVDCHEVRRWLSQGCGHDTAVSILI